MAKSPCDCSKYELLEEKLNNCKQEKIDSCESERTELKTQLEATKKKLMIFQILCAVSLAILGKEGASEAISYFTSVESVASDFSDVTKEVTVNVEDDDSMFDGPFRPK